jgi:probable phosphoglycerate mutase
MGELILLRHGETEWSRTGRHTGLTDVPLTPAGEAAAAALAPMLAGRDIRCACASPLQRAARTAALAGLDDVKQDPDLREWDYGGYEGMTTPQIREQWPGWYLWRDGVIPGGAGRRTAVPARHGHPVHAGHRARRARDHLLERSPLLTAR